MRTAARAQQPTQQPTVIRGMLKCKYEQRSHLQASLAPLHFTICIACQPQCSAYTSLHAAIRPLFVRFRIACALSSCNPTQFLLPAWSGALVGSIQSGILANAQWGIQMIILCGAMRSFAVDRKPQAYTVLYHFIAFLLAFILCRTW